MSAAADAGTWGGVRIAGIDLALPLSVLREVVPGGELTALPSGQPGVIGALALRGASVPVVDLGAVLGRMADTTAALVLLVVHGERLLGLACQAVHGVFAAEAGSRVTPADGAEAPAGRLFDGSVRRADNGALVNLLSVEALAALPGLPWIADPEPRRRHEIAPDEAETAPRRALMLLHAGSVRLAIDAEAVETTLWQPVLDRSVLARGHCRGTLEVAGQRVGALDLVALCGLHDRDAAPRGQAVVVRRPEGLAALLVERVVDIVPAAAEAIVHGRLVGLTGGPLFAGLYSDPRWGEHLLLDVEALGRQPELQTLAATNVAIGAGATAGRGTATAAATAGETTLLTLRLPHEVAVPIDQVDEVLPFGGVDAMFGPDAPLRRVQRLRGQVVPVLCLARLLGGHPGAAAPSAAVLVVRAGDGWIGFATPQMNSIEPCAWRRRLPAHEASGAAAQEVVGVGAAGSQRTLRLVDLRSLAQALAAEALRAAA